MWIAISHLSFSFETTPDSEISSCSDVVIHNTVDRSIDIAIQTQGIVSDEYDFRSQEEINQEIEAIKQELTEWKEAIQDDVALYNRQADQEYAVSKADAQDFSGADEEDIDL